MPKIKIYTATAQTDGSGTVLLDLEGLDDAGTAIPGTRQTVAIANQLIIQIGAETTGALRAAKVLALMPTICPALSKDALQNMIAANAAVNTVTTTFLTKLTLPVTLTYA